MTTLSRMDILLLRYAAGSLDASETMLVVVVLVFNHDARRKVAEYEALGGQILQDEAPAPISVDCLEVIMKRIEAEPPSQDRLRSFWDWFLRS